MPIVWREALSLTEPHIDQQHKSIINSLNALEKARHEKDRATIGTLFANLLPYFRKHFKEEEHYFDEIAFPHRDSHRQLHTALLGRCEELQFAYSRASDEGGRMAAVDGLQSFLAEYLVEHVLKEDLKAKPFLKRDGGGASSMMALDERAKEDDERRRARRERDVEYRLPDHLAYLLKRIEFDVPDMPPPVGGFTSFEALCEAAIFRRLDRVLLFFHRRNPELKRELPPFFLGSPQFRAKFHEAQRQLILPLLKDSRQIHLAASSLDLKTLDDENFWTMIEPTLRANIMQWWRLSWASMRPIAVRREEDGRQVWKVKDELKRLREILQPDAPEDYDLPKIGQKELDLFASLLDVDVDWWSKLNLAWTIFVDLYEQEKDPRIFQQAAREGALRDFMLESFNKFPLEWLDFMLLACHYAFPRVTTQFLDNFTRNYENRDNTLPYTMRFLGLIDAKPEIRHREIRAEAEYRRQREELRAELAKIAH